jgi:sodium-dependent dicarboxylate transporter 2/3/5
MWISNTAATALMLPIGLGVLRTLRDASAGNTGPYRIGLMLMLSYGATAGGMATIIGTPPNLIGAGLIAQQTTVSISFVTWLAFGLPLALLMLVSAWGLLSWFHPSSTPALSHFKQSVSEQRLALGPWTAGQVNACIAFGTAIILWVGPGLLSAFWGPRHPLITWLEAHVPNELVALLVAGLLFMLPTDLRNGEFTLSWKQAANIHWGIILLFGGGLAFGELMTRTGLSDAAGQGFVNLFGLKSMWGLTAVSILAGVLISELASNTASASMLIPLVIAIAQAAGISAVPPALGACLGASLGFALPVSTPPNAIVYGTGLVPMRSMIRTGLLFDVLGAILIWLTLRVVCPLLGLI